ncbi:MAG: nuclear transport factor 2 family protein [Candidatus Omnitrophica bacterium]|jgi:hypothetical protein|nr:nuclear transport factor 2 family protein [Candidatus Omnitrophota bacterium]
MKKNIIVTIVVIAISIIFSAGIYAESDMSVGEMLERQMWEDMKTGKTEMYEPKIADAFQSIHEDGMRGRGQEIKLIKDLGLGDYKLSKFDVTRQADTIVVTYLAQISKETVGGTQLSDTPTPRLSVWIKTEKGWQWLAHANLNMAKK